MLNAEFGMLNVTEDPPQHPVADRAYRGEIIRVFTPEIGNHATGNQVAMVPRMRQGEDLKARTRQFAIEVIRFRRTLPSTFEARRRDLYGVTEDGARER